MYLPINTLLQGGKYKIIRYISSGGFGCTYEAEHTILQNRVAIKEFFVKDFCNRDETTSQVTVGITSKRGLVEKLRKKFVEEARAIFQLQHPNIIRVLDVFEENGTAYYVMDYIDGLSLEGIVKREGPLAEGRALKYIRQVAGALQHVHNHNRLHLDVKPGNIMIDGSDQAILIDFGTSKQYDEVDGENTSTLIGKTPGYAPLEQMGNDVVQFQPATDIYALGATLYKLLTGITPLGANRLASGEELAPLPNGTSEQVAKAIRSAMQINRANRPQDIATFLALLGSNSIQGDGVTDLDVKPRPSYQPEDKEAQTNKPTTRTINGHEWVDLGLSVKWATCNVGASTPSDYGDYFAWGETRTKSEYTAETNVTDGMDMSSIAGDLQYDAATANWGDTWRLPTVKEIDELINKCSWERRRQMGHEGYKVTGPNGNSIFLPAAGWREGMELNDAGEDGGYWSATPNEVITDRAYGVNFDSSHIGRGRDDRSKGRSVRPVSGEVPPAPPSNGTINGHEWVDLGLSVKWATCNVGASTPSDYGDYYAWGETRTKLKYKERNSITYRKSMGNIAGNPQYDAARANWGGSWRLPTVAEIEELINECKREWTTLNGHKGYKVTGPNGNSIFLPAAGWRHGTSRTNAGEYGTYWSASPDEINTSVAYRLLFDSDYFVRRWYYRDSGQSVRSVSE